MNSHPLLKLTLILASIFLVLSPKARAVEPPPDGGYPNGNTAEGDSALLSLTTGGNNTAIGFDALSNTQTGGDNTAIGWQALFHNTLGSGNTATGVNALGANTVGSNNTATGSQALLQNTEGQGNTANGAAALYSNTTGFFNTALGNFSLDSNTSGVENTGTGFEALLNNTAGSHNTANGFEALYSLKTGNYNIALGYGAGSLRRSGDNNIDIGNSGVGKGSDTIRIGKKQSNTYIAGISGVTVAGGVGVVVDTAGHLGTIVSSERFKDSIKPMDKASEAILALQPVTFQYKRELDPAGIPQFGLVAEQVEKVNPDLVAHDEQGKPYTVRYEAVNAMLLNEFLKEHRGVQELKSTVAKQEAVIERQQRDIQMLTASLKEQASQIQNVSDRLDQNQSGKQLVADSK